MFKKSPLVLALLFSAAGANAVPSHKVCSNESGNARNTSNIYFSDDCNYAYVGLPNYGKATLNGYTSMNLDQCQNYDQVNDSLQVIIESAQRNTRRIAEFTNELEEVQQKINELEEERVGFELEAEDLEEQIAHIEENVLPPLVQDKRDKRKIFLECKHEAQELEMDVREYCSESYQAYRDANRLYRDQNKVMYSLLDSKTRASSRESRLSRKITRLRRDRSSLEELLISAKNRVNDLLKDVQESKQYYFRIYGATASLLFTTDVDSYINEKRRAFEAGNTGFENLIWKGISPLPNSTEIDFLVNNPGGAYNITDPDYPIMSIATPDNLFRKPGDTAQFFSASGNKDYLEASPFPNSFSAVLTLNVAGACDIENQTNKAELFNYVKPNLTAMFEVKGTNSYTAEINLKKVVEFFQETNQLAIQTGVIKYSDIKRAVREADNLGELVSITFTSDAQDKNLERRPLEENLVERAVVTMLDTVSKRTISPDIDRYRQEVADGVAELPTYNTQYAESGVTGARFVDSGMPAISNIQWFAPANVNFEQIINDYKIESDEQYIEEVTGDSFTPVYQSFGFIAE